MRYFFFDCCYFMRYFSWTVAASATITAALSRCQSCIGGHNANLEAAESLGNVYLKMTPLSSSVVGAPGDAFDRSSPQLWGAVDRSSEAKTTWAVRGLERYSTLLWIEIQGS